MAALAELFLRSLLEKFPHPSSQKVMGDLPQDISERFTALPERAGADPEMFLVTPSRILSSLHPSWFEELVNGVPEGIRPAVQRSLDEYQQGQEETPLRAFLLGYLVNCWPEKNTPCLESVAQSEFSWLLECNSEEVESLVSLVAMCDLVEQVRQTIDKKSLQQLFACLSSVQQQYLRALLHMPLSGLKSKISLSDLVCLSQEEAKESLRARGYERLAFALCGESPTFIWYLLHKLERSQARLLEARLNETASEESLLPRARAQLTHAYQFLKRREST